MEVIEEKYNILDTDCKIGLAAGDKAIQLLNDEQFAEAWKDLYKRCSWATVFQSVEYISCWYNAYQNKHKLVIVYAIHGGKIIGLLPLSFYGNKLIDAVQWDSEYQTWLADEVNNNEFIKLALLHLRKSYPKHHIVLKYIPEGTPLDWLKYDRKWDSKCVINKRKSPYFNIYDTAFIKLQKSRNFKIKQNRLAKLGVLSLERIHDKASFESIYETIIAQRDFRKLARYNRDHNHLKEEEKAFKLNLFEQNLIHVTVIKLNGFIIAACESVINVDSLCLVGLKTYDPVYAYYSIGMLHFLMLSKEMEQEGIENFDLTPGDDPYKARLATNYKDAYDFIFPASKHKLIEHKIRKEISDFLNRNNITTITLKNIVYKKLHLLKERIRITKEKGFSLFIRETLIRLSFKKESNIYVIKLFSNTIPTPQHVDIKLNDYKAFLSYKPAKTQLSNWQFLEKAMTKFEARIKCYTLVQNGLLLCSTWINPITEEHLSTGSAIQAITNNDIVLKDIYCHPDGEANLKPFLAAVAGDLGKTESKAQMAIVVEQSNLILCNTLEKVGFSKLHL